MAALSYAEQVQQAYLAYYGRPADPAGQQYWVNQLTAANGNLNSIINAFGNSAESTALYGGSSTAAQVNAIYQTLFGRAADVTGLNFYVNGIVSGQFTLASVALNIYNGATGTDATELTAKLSYADSFTAALSQSVAGQVAYSGNAAASNARAAVASVVDLTSQATATAALSTTIANIGTGTVAQTATLTTGVDGLTLSASNAVNGLVSDANGAGVDPTTLNVTDSIKGNGAQDSLSVTYTQANGTADATNGALISGIQTFNIRNTVAGKTVALDASKDAGLTQLNSNLSSGNVAVTNLATGAHAGIIGNGSLTEGTLSAGYKTAADAAIIDLSSGVKQTAAAGSIAITSAPASVTINSTGAANIVGGIALGGSATTLTINASSNLTVADALAGTADITGFSAGSTNKIVITGSAASVNLGEVGSTVATLDASGLTAGGLTDTLLGATTVVKGGAGNDVITLTQALTGAAGQLDLGAGVNTLVINSAANEFSTAAQTGHYANVQILGETGNAGVADVSLLSTITGEKAILSAGAGDAQGFTNLTAAQATNITVTDAGDAAAVASLSIGVKGAATPGQVDTVALTVVSSDAATTNTNGVKVTVLNADGVENLAIHDNVGAASTNGLVISSLVAGASHTNSFQSVTIDGAGSLNLTTGAVAAPLNFTIDASANTGKFVTIDASGVTANGLLIKGGAGLDTITGSGLADTIDISASTTANNSVTGGIGGDTIKLGTHSGIDTVKYIAADLPTAIATDDTAGFTTAMAAADQIFGFNAGANHDVISHGTLVLASNDGIGAALAFAAATPVNFNAGSLNFASTALKTATVVDVQTQLSGDFTTVAGIKSGVDSFLTAAAFDPAKTFKGLVELHDTAGNEAVLYVNHVAAATAAVTEVSLVGVLHGTTGNLAASNFA